jgi:hypothetical protein
MEITIKTQLPDYCEPFRIVTSAADILSIGERLGIEAALGDCVHRLDGLVKKHEGKTDLFVCAVGHHQNIVAGFFIVYREGRSDPYRPRLLLFRCPEEKITADLLKTALDFTEEYAAKLIESQGGSNSFRGGPLSSL